MAYISITSTTETSISVKLDDLDTSYAGTTRTVRWYIDGTYKSSKTLPNGASSGAAYTFTGLDSYTQYEIEAYVYNDNNTNLLVPKPFYESARTKKNVRPNEFSWKYAKVKGGTFNLTAQEWNDFTDNINELRVYKGLSEYNFTTAYKGDIFMAKMYNEARRAIQGISGYGTYIPTVSSGDTITAYMMNIIVSELNSIP